MSEYFIRRLSRHAWWMKRKSGVIIAMAAAYGAVKLVDYLFYSSAGDLQPSAPLWLVAAATFTITFLLILFAWYAAREAYWRTGRAPKIGIAIDSYKIDGHDIKALDNSLQRAFDTNSRSRPVSIRYFPAAKTATNRACDDIRKKYKLDYLVQIKVEKALDGNELPVFRPQFSSTLKSAFDRSFLESTCIHAIMAMTLKSARPPASTKDFFEYNAAGIRDAVLIFLAADAFVAKQYDRASVLIRLVDDDLRAVPLNEQPRKALRWLDAQCMAASSHFGIADMPDGYELKNIQERLTSAAQRYGQEFPFIYVLLSRVCFLRGDLASAKEASYSATVAERSDNKIKRVGTLNLAVCDLFSGNWQMAAAGFSAYFASQEWKSLNWDDLIDFAQYAAQIDEPPAEYLECLYRLIKAPTQVDQGLRDRAMQWAAGDKSRQPLVKFLRQPPRLNEQRKRRAGSQT